MIGIEGEERRVDLVHDAAQQSGRFNRLNALLGQYVGEGIDFERQFAKSIVGYGASRAKGIIFFPQRSDNVSECLERAHDLIKQGEGKHQPKKNLERGKRELHVTRPCMRPDENSAEANARKGCQDSKEGNAPFEQEP